MEKALELLAQMKMICLVADVYTYDKKGGAMKEWHLCEMEVELNNVMEYTIAYNVASIKH